MDQKRRKIKKIKFGSYRDVDPTNFRFSINLSQTPTNQIESLLTELSIEHMELITQDIFDINTPLQKRKYRVNEVTIKGKENYIMNMLGEIHPILEKYFFEYAISEETALNKIYELSNCKYLIKEFIYKINLEEPSLYRSKDLYKVWFPNGDSIDNMHASHFAFLAKARREIHGHHVIRIAFLDLLYQYIDLQQEKVKMLEIKKELLGFPENVKKEKEILEVWLALKEAGHLSHLNKGIDISNHRKEFFKSFNLLDKDYNDRHNNLKKEKYKVEYLRKLAALLENAFKKKNQPPK